MEAEALGGGEEVDAPPAHLQKGEGENQEKQRPALVPVKSAGGAGNRPAGPWDGLPLGMLLRPLAGLPAEMQVQEVAQPGGGCPGLFRIPGPVVPPGLFRPQGTHHHPHRKEAPADAHKRVAKAKVVRKRPCRGGGAAADIRVAGNIGGSIAVSITGNIGGNITGNSAGNNRNAGGAILPG